MSRPGACLMCGEVEHAGLCPSCDTVRDLDEQAVFFSHQSADVHRLQYIRMKLGEAIDANPGESVSIPRGEALNLLGLLTDAEFIAEAYAEASDFEYEAANATRSA